VVVGVVSVNRLSHIENNWNKAMQQGIDFEEQSELLLKEILES
jgi:hypothetical protein